MRAIGRLGLVGVLVLGGGAAAHAQVRPDGKGKPVKEGPSSTRSGKATPPGRAHDGKPKVTAAAASGRTKANTPVGKGEADGAPNDGAAGVPGPRIRQGSFLRRSDAGREEPDLRGELERRRDLEMRRHYARMAELDAIQEVGREAKDDALMDRVEAIRRKEERRYWAVMQEFRALVWAKTVRGAP